jgi:hypothetical protein
MNTTRLTVRVDFLVQLYGLRYGGNGAMFKSQKNQVFFVIFNSLCGAGSVLSFKCVQCGW